MIRGLHHASITTHDLARLTRFYCKHFGFEPVLDVTWDGGNPRADLIYGLQDTAVKMVMLKSSNAFLELFEFVRPKGRQRVGRRPVNDCGLTHICIVVDGIDAHYERLVAAGVPFDCPPQVVPGLCSATYGQDPDGNIIELMEADPAGPFGFPPS